LKKVDVRKKHHLQCRLVVTLHEKTALPSYTSMLGDI